MMHQWSFIVFLLFSNQLILAQENDAKTGGFISLPDTFKFAPPVQPRAIPYDSIPGKPSDTLTGSDIYLFSSGKTYSPLWFLVYPFQNKWLAIPLFAEYDSPSYVYFVDSIQVDLNANGSLEVPIKWESYAGHTGWESAIHERWGGLKMWDVKLNQQLFDFDSFYQLESWWTQYEEDSTNTLSYEEREVIDSGGEMECDFFEVYFETKTIVIKATNDCWMEQDDSPQEKLKVPIFTYSLIKTKFILQQ